VLVDPGGDDDGGEFEGFALDKRQDPPRQRHQETTSKMQRTRRRGPHVAIGGGGWLKGH